MRKFFEYNVDLSTLKVIKDVDKQFDKFFSKGHRRLCDSRQKRNILLNNKSRNRLILFNI